MKKKLLLIVCFVALLLLMVGASSTLKFVQSIVGSGGTIVSSNLTTGRWTISGGATNFDTAITATNGVTITKGALIVGPNGGSVTNILTFSANLDFPSIGPSTNTDLVITCTGATTNDAPCLQSPPIVANIPNASFTAFCSNDSVWVKFTHNGTNPAAAINPGASVFRGVVFKF